MSLQRVMPWLITLLAVTILAMMIAARAGLSAATSGSAAVFALAVVATSWRTNVRLWTTAATEQSTTSLEPIHAARRNARLAALTYAWAALGMLGLYTTPLTGLRWQHGWQYATAFGLLSIFALAYTHLSGSRNSSMRQKLQQLAGPLAAAQATLAALGLAFLVMSGTLQSRRPDWAANVIFLYATLTIMIITAVALRTHIRLTRDAA